MKKRIREKRYKKRQSEIKNTSTKEYQETLKGGCMLNEDRIIQAIKNNEIEVTISFDKDPQSKKIEPIGNREGNLLKSSMSKNLYSDRLKITLGPIVKVLRNKPIPKKNRFKNNKYCYDLRTSDNKYLINPGESLIVLTNECIRLSGKYACIVVPRISLSDVGIVVSTAYVDPYYNGVMRLHITNLSDKYYELSILESIAQCFFFELPSPVDQTYKDQFSTKSVFFGHTWKGILESDMNPFPIKKAPAEIDGLENVKHQISIIWDCIKRKGLIWAVGVNAFVIVSGIVMAKQTLETYSNVIEQVQQESTPISCEILIKKDNVKGEKSVFCEYPKEEIISVLCNNNDVHYKIESGSTTDESVITFSYLLDVETNIDTEISFSYVIIRRK